jgi:hypothetical protein
MAVAGYAGLPRFLAPASAAIAVVGGVGVARAGGAAFPRPSTQRVLALAAAAALLSAVAGFGLRAAEVPGDLRRVNHQAELLDGLFDLADRVPTDRLLSCGGHVRLANLFAPPTALAWHLDRPLAAVRVNPHPKYGVALSTRPLPGELLMQMGRWRATDLSC